jgi:hypothetical protein
MTSKKNKPLPSDSDVAMPRYRGPDRRDADADEENVESVLNVEFDVKGDPVLQAKSSVPRRREDDKPVNLLDHLDLDSLSLQDEDSSQDEKIVRPGGGYDPYNRNDE